MRVLGIETSCDETAAAIVDERRIIANEVWSQANLHATFGGVVPEIASREHINILPRLVDQVIHANGGYRTLDGIAVTRGPGLLGALLVGMQFAKGLALALGVPWIGVNHLEGHLAACRLDGELPPYPHLALLVSGGHTHLYRVDSVFAYRLLGGTRDDAAGEAFDKSAKLLGLGYPGGPIVDRLAQLGDPSVHPLPRGLPGRGDLDFSFSGLKTAVARCVAQLGPDLESQTANVCASVQEAIVAVLVRKTVAALRREGLDAVVVAGGVAANSSLQSKFREEAARAGFQVFLPTRALCTDNAAMIAEAGAVRLARGERSSYSESALARWPLAPGSVSKGRFRREATGS